MTPALSFRLCWLLIREAFTSPRTVSVIRRDRDGEFTVERRKA